MGDTRLRPEPASPARLESFSDGVIAVILTLMVLDLRLPSLEGLAGLRSSLPGLGIYLLSFTFTGIYWLNHQDLIRRLKAAGYRIFVTNLFFLFFLSLLPLSTRYLIARKATPYSVQQYAATLEVVALAFYVLRMAVHKHLRSRNALTEWDRVEERQHLWSLGGYLAAIPIAAWAGAFALILIMLQTVAWGTPWKSLIPRRSTRGLGP